MAWNLLGGLMPPENDAKSKSNFQDSGAEEEFEILEPEEARAKERRHSGDSGIEGEEKSEVSDSEGVQAVSCNTPPEDLNLENEILANFPDGCDRSLTVELKDEDSYDIISQNLTLAEIINILNQAIQKDNCEKLDEVVQNIEDYEGRSVVLGSGNFKNFCLQQLNLDLQSRSDHQHIYSNILSQYKFDQEEFKYTYSVKELALLAIAANDKLAERYQDVFFAEGNLSLLPLLVGSQKYIETFVKKFHGTNGVYGRLKDQVIQLVEPNRIGFFSAIALRKEQALLNTVFVEYVLKGLEQVLKTSNPDPLYGVLETASLIKNEEFITIVLNSFERYINEPTKKALIEELLKKSFATLLETAISQEHISTVEYLRKRYINSKDCASYSIYGQAFVDDKVIEVLNRQILKNIEARGRKEIYDLVLKTALDAGNSAFIERLCEKCTKCSNDVIGHLNQKFKNNEFDEVYESILIALSNIGSKDIIVRVLAHIQIYQNVPHNEQVIRQTIRNILNNAIHCSKGQEGYSLVKEVCYLCTEVDAINVIFQEECGISQSSIEKCIEDLEKKNKLLQPEASHKHNYSYLPGIVNGLVQVAHAAYDAYTKDQEPNKRQEDPILRLMHIRNILQFSIDVQEYHCHERQNLWNAMYQTPGTFIIRKRSDNVADKLTISVIKSDILSHNPKPKSASNQQPQKNTVDESKNIMNNGETSKVESIGNSHEGGEMDGDKKSTKSIEERLSGAIWDVNFEEVKRLVEQGGKDITQSVLSKALEEANETGVGKKDKVSKGKLKKIKELLETRLKSIGAEVAASSTGGNVEDTTTSGQETPVNIDDKEASQSVELEDDRRSSSHSSESSADGGENSNDFFSMINTPSDNGDISNGDYVKVSPSDSPQDTQRGVDDQVGDDQQDSPSPLSLSSDDEDDEVFSISGVGDEEEPLLKQPDDTQDTDGRPDSAPQSTKGSKKPVIAVSALAIAGVVLGVAIAVHLEMLAVGIAVGACCLIAAAVMYYCTPKSLVENSEAEKVVPDKEKLIGVSA
ncbi:MAG: host RNA manipulator TomO [Wolbachia sp.]